MNTFHTCDTFPCFFGFTNTNDTEIARVRGHVNDVLQLLSTLQKLSRNNSLKEPCVWTQVTHTKVKDVLRMGPDAK